MSPGLNAATREALQARLRFYRELGLTEFYQRPVDAAQMAAFLAATEAEAASAAAMAPDDTAMELQAPHAPEPNTIPNGPRPASPPPAGPISSEPAPAGREATQPAPVASMGFEDTAISARRLVDPPPPITGAVPVAQRAEALRLIREELGDCTRCALHTGRNKIVFADGDPAARLMFVGEGPGADEDAQGLPFVGKAGQLLNNMITAMGLKREEVYIANVVKCRPPGNRTPEPVEANTCSPFLFKQIDVVRPEILVALGATAATYLLGQRQPLAGLRGRIHSVRGCRLIVTYHPAYLLRDPRQKKEAWADLQIAMKELGLKAPARG